MNIKSIFLSIIGIFFVIILTAIISGAFISNNVDTPIVYYNSSSSTYYLEKPTIYAGIYAEKIDKIFLIEGTNLIEVKDDDLKDYSFLRRLDIKHERCHQNQYYAKEKPSEFECYFKQFLP